MSRLSIDSLQVLLAPNAVQAAPRSGWTGRLGRPKLFPVGLVDAEQAWERPMDAFRAALRHFGLRRVRVELSQAFVQLRVLPWRAELLNAAEVEAMARHELSAAYGSMADDWRVTLSDESPGRSRLVAATPHPLLHALQSQAAQAGARLVSVEPALVAASRRWSAWGAAEACHWLVQHEASRLSVLIRHQRQWVWVRHARVDNQWLEQLPQWLSAEALMSGQELAPARVSVQAVLDAAGQRALRGMGLRQIECGWLP